MAAAASPRSPVSALPPLTSWRVAATRDAAFTVLGVSYQQSLTNYIKNALGCEITAADYPEGGEGRITQLP